MTISPLRLVSVQADICPTSAQIQTLMAPSQLTWKPMGVEARHRGLRHVPCFCWPNRTHTSPLEKPTSVFGKVGPEKPGAR